MGFFDRIRDAIFHRGAEQAHPTTTAPSTPTGSRPNPASTTSTSPSVAPPTVAPAAPVDVEIVLEGLAAKNDQKLNWRTSIVDLMKVVDLDPSLANRKALASELGYSGDTNDSATMNIWLHKQVMTKLAANGGRVPASLRD